MKSDDPLDFKAESNELTVNDEVTGALNPDNIELIGPGNECREKLYSSEDPCAGPHHVCQERGGHEEHECFCGFTWSEEEIQKALDLSRRDFATFVRYQEGLG